MHLLFTQVYFSSDSLAGSDVNMQKGVTKGTQTAPRKIVLNQMPKLTRKPSRIFKILWYIQKKEGNKENQIYKEQFFEARKIVQSNVKEKTYAKVVLYNCGRIFYIIIFRFVYLTFRFSKAENLSA